MSLSVCLLTRNEEAKIARAINSVRGLADQIVVVDTGSHDQTVETARAAGAQVLSIDWDDDFSAGRNLALENATNDWILWMNPDEELRPGSHDALRDCLTDDRALGFLVTIRDQLHADRPQDWSESLDLRIFRRRNDLRYVSRLHPGFPEAATQTALAEGLETRVSAVVLERHAYESVLDESRLRWALRLLDRELTDRPGNLPYMIERADTLLRLDDPAGHDAMAEVAEAVARVRDADQPPSDSVQVLLTYLLRTPEDQIKGPLRPADAEALVSLWFPRSPVPLWTIAEKAFARQDFETAVSVLHRLIEMGQTGLYDRSRGFDPSLLKRHAWANLGAGLLALGRLNESQACFQHLLTSDPEAQNQAEQGLAAVAARRRQGGS